MNAEHASSFWQWLSLLPQYKQSDVFLSSLFAAAATLVLITGIITFTMYKIHRSRLNDSLKRELLDHGMTADDIVAVIRATPIKGGPHNSNDERFQI